MIKSLSFSLSLSLLLTVGCGGKGSPTDPTPASVSSTNTAASCATGCDNVIHIPDASMVRQQMESARDAVRAAVADGSLQAKRTADWNAVPSVEWRACFFLVNNVSWVENGVTMVGSNCAAGLTDFGARKIVIATNDQGRTGPLIRWETANFFLVAIGRQDLADKWQATH